MKKFIAEKEFWELFPEAMIAVLSVKNIQESKLLSNEEAKEVNEILVTANEEAKKYLTSEVISENEIPALWRKAYQKFPTKKGARVAIESLLKRVLHGNPVGSIAPSVDLTNAVSLRFGFPIGAENLKAVVGDLRLGLMKGGEDFLPIGSDKQEPPLTGELAYYDEAGVICRCWNWRDGQRTAVNEDTTAEFIAMECIELKRRADLEQALKTLEEYLVRYLGAEVIVSTIVDKEHPEVVIED